MRIGKGVSIEVEFSVDGCVVGKALVCVGILEEGESDHGLVNETILFLGGKVRIVRSEFGAKTIFECVNHTFCGIAEGGVQGDKLKVNVVFGERFLHGVGALIVEDVDSGVYTVLFEVFVARRPGCSDIQGLSVLENLGVDGVGVEVVEDEDLLIPV